MGYLLGVIVAAVPLFLLYAAEGQTLNGWEKVKLGVAYTAFAAVWPLTLGAWLFVILESSK